MAADRAQKSSLRKVGGGAFVELDEGARARLETELRNHLAAREPEIATAVLARVAGTSASSEKRNIDQWFELAARALADDRALLGRIKQLSETSRVALALLSKHPWWSRSALVQAVVLARGGAPTDDAGKAIGDVLSRWPVLVRSNAWTRTEELSLFEPLGARLRPLLEDALAIGRRKNEAIASVGLGRTLLALSLFPGLVAQRRPRVTRSGELHAADATKLERALGEARGLFATWDRLAAFEEVDGALSPISGRVRRLLDDPGGLVAEFKQRLGDLGWSLATLAAQADAGDVLDLGASLLAVGMRSNFGFGFDVPTLASHVERDDLHLSPLVRIDADADALTLPIDVRAAIRGEPLAIGPAAHGFVQPNYEVVLPPGVPLGAAFVVGCAGELVHYEAVARLKLTRESVLAARGVGIDVTDVVEALKTVSGPRGLPPAVEHAVGEWGESVGEARVRTAVLLEVRAADALLDRVSEKLAGVIVERPTPNLFVLSRAPTPRELAILRGAGVLVRAVAASSSAKTHAEDEVAVEATPVEAKFADRSTNRDLRIALDPHRILDLVEASRSPKRASQNAPSSARGAIDPDEGSVRPIPPAVESALEDKRVEWAQRPDWAAQLRSIAESPSFRRAAAIASGALILAIRRSGEPSRLHLEIARIAAEASVRRVAD